MIERGFNIGGPCFPQEHYMLPPERRLSEVMDLVERGKYFTLHAGRQTGKTTCAQWLVKHLNAGDRFSALWVDVETAREEPDPATALLPVLEKLDMAVDHHLPKVGHALDLQSLLASPRTAVIRYLRDLAARCPKPLVVFFDEADCLVGKAMVSFLTQLRDGYLARHEAPFPHSIALVGQRAVRDYMLAQQDRRAVSWLGTASPFNITTEALTLEAFTPAEIEELLVQHTHATGQRFEPAAVAHVAALTMGHPWLVNAIADQVVRKEARDRSIVITAAHVEAAKEAIILSRRTHIDSLIHKLREPRVAAILAPMLAGDNLPSDVLDDDVAYVLGLGLIRVVRGEYVISNPIYREVIPRALTWVKQHSLHQPIAWYLRPDGALDVPKLMAAWQVFWREDGHLGAEGFGYRESGPHLMLMAFLQRVINGGGAIHREYGLGRGALDLLIAWRGARYAIEVKLRRDTQTEERALEQMARYLDSLGLGEGWLVMFDLRSTLPWTERLTNRTVVVDQKEVHLVGC